MRGRALLIATSHYGDPQLSTLRSTRIDAEGLRQVLVDPQRGDYTVTTCLDAPSHTWRDRIGDFFQEAGRQDLLLLYLSGHGIKDKDGNLYFAASDTRVRRLLQTAVPASFIREAARQSPSRRVVMIFDTCFSGAFARGVQVMSDATVNTGEYFRDSTGTVVITASDAIQYALVEDTVSARAPGSLFSKHIIHGLATGEADMDEDGQITTEELYHYAARGLRADTRDQQPQRWTYDMKGDFVVASNPAPRASALPPQVRELVEHAAPEQRLLAVHRLENLLTSGSVSEGLAARAALERLRGDPSRAVSGAALAVLQERAAPAEVRRPRRSTGLLQGAVVLLAALVLLLVWRPWQAVPELVRQEPVDTPVNPAGSVPAPATSAATSTVRSATGATAIPLSQDRPVPPVSASDAAAGLEGHRVGATFQDCTAAYCPQLVVVPAGSFRMGSPGNQFQRPAEEAPLHDVHIGQAFAVGRYPVTRAEWKAYLAASGRAGTPGCYGRDESGRGWKVSPAFSWENPGYPQEETHPVVCVSWNDAQDFTAWLSQKTGHHYRLLSEAEYEYINRGGSGAVYFWGDSVSEHCSYSRTGYCSDRSFTAPVGVYRPNGFNLYDTTGNVWSWTQDCDHGTYDGAPEDGTAWISGGNCSLRMVRGGSWDEGAQHAAARYRLTAPSMDGRVGLRVARTR